MKETRAESNRWIRIARCHDIPLREGRAVKVGNREIAIFNLGSRFLAVDNRCPHKGGPLADGIISGAAVVCPLHAWSMESFSLSRATTAGRNKKAKWKRCRWFAWKRAGLQPRPSHVLPLDAC